MQLCIGVVKSILLVWSIKCAYVMWLPLHWVWFSSFLGFFCDIWNCEFTHCDPARGWLFWLVAQQLQSCAGSTAGKPNSLPQLSQPCSQDLAQLMKGWMLVPPLNDALPSLPCNRSASNPPIHVTIPDPISTCDQIRMRRGRKTSYTNVRFPYTMIYGGRSIFDLLWKHSSQVGVGPPLIFEAEAWPCRLARVRGRNQKTREKLSSYEAVFSQSWARNIKIDMAEVHELVTVPVSCHCWNGDRTSK